MRPLFTIHAGEFLVGEYLEKRFPGLNIWIPTKDTGVDLLATNPRTRQMCTLQVKLTRDYKAQDALDDFQRGLEAGGWLALRHEAIERSTADYWVIVLVSHERRRNPIYLVVPPTALLRSLEAERGKATSYHFYPWVLRSGPAEKRVALNGRGMGQAQRAALAAGTLHPGARDLSAFLDAWGPLEALAAGT